MKLRVLILSLLACAATGSAQEPAREGEIYAAHGTEPFWGLTFEDGKMVWIGDEQRIQVVRPAPRPRGNVHVYRTPRMTVEISHEGRCNDGMSDYEYPDTVRIRFGRRTGGRALEGCGGGVLPPVTLADTRWQIVDIDGIHVGGSDYKLGFEDDGQARGQAGCNRFSAPYGQTRRTLTLTPIEATRMRCDEDRNLHESRVLQLLSGPVQIRYRGAMIMMLSGNRGGTEIFMTLRRL